MRTTEIKLYKFEELSDEVQNKLIEKNRDVLVQYDDWYHPIMEGFCEDMSEAGHDIDPKDISFSGFWSQGDGASFTTKNGSLSLRPLLKELGVKMKDLPRGTGNEIKEGLIEIGLSRTTHHYCHENTVRLWMDYHGENKAIRESVLGLYDQIEEILKDKMRNLYSSLEKYHDELTEDAAIKSELIEQENEYFKDGRKFAA